VVTTLKEECKLQAYEYKVLRKTFRLQKN